MSENTAVMLNTMYTDFLFDFDFIIFNATFSNISAISLRPVLVVEEAGVRN
jgi:hypothetical protein